ncbi:uncharacterized protein METZ01_LOCUS384977 [marine metagenome]|uniref:Uncharacterized protein n=1 Tax=marine metagenome TaxID=408172 RepID=A0A382UCZ9_9ZZZZ
MSLVRSQPRQPDVDSSSIGRAPDCDSGGCEFDSRLSTQKGNMIVNILKFWMVLVVLAHIVLLLQAIN